MWTAIVTRRSFLVAFAFIFATSFFLIRNQNKSFTWSQKNETIFSSTHEGVWISISVCFSSNTHLHGKQHYPYKEATLLSSSLWRQIAQKQVIVQVVYEAKDENSDELFMYVRSLQEAGAKVETVLSQGEIQCSQKSQLQRLFAFQFPYIMPNDIIVVADADTFVMNRDVLYPLENENYKIWIFQYHYSMMTANTFPMDYIAMRAQLWSTIINAQSAEELIAKNEKDLQLKTRSSTWNDDQLILTRLILQSGLCSAPKNHDLWKNVKLQPMEMSDTETCFHGTDQWSDCNIGRLTNPFGKCFKWHFYPHQTAKEMRDKYEEIISV